MPSTIKLRRGNAASLPTLNAGEPAIALDTQTLYYGTGTGNINLTPIRWIGATPEYPSGSNTIGRYTLNIVSPLVENYNAVDLRAYISGGTKLDQVGPYSFAAGYGTKAQGSYSTAFNMNNTVTGTQSFACNTNNSISSGQSFACGIGNTITSNESFVAGTNNTCSHTNATAFGWSNAAAAMSSTAFGRQNYAGAYGCLVCGVLCEPGTGQNTATFTTTNNAFIIGNGTSTSAKSNCFRVKFDGSVYGIGAYNSSGADYAEFFEWEDGNPEHQDRVGKFVYLSKDDKISICDSTPISDVLGVVSATPAVKGNTASSNWHGMYLKDNFGRTLYEENSEGGTVPKINPEYKSEDTYIPRENRPEWDAIGFLGRLRVYDDGSCVSGSYCNCGANGIAIKSAEGFKVLKRISTNVVEILMK